MNPWILEPNVVPYKNPFPCSYNELNMTGFCETLRQVFTRIMQIANTPDFTSLINYYNDDTLLQEVLKAAVIECKCFTSIVDSAQIFLIYINPLKQWGQIMYKQPTFTVETLKELHVDFLQEALYILNFFGICEKIPRHKPQSSIFLLKQFPRNL